MNFHLNIFSRIKDAWNYRSEPERTRFIAGIYWRSLLALLVCVAVAAIFLGIGELGAVMQASSTEVSGTGGGTPSISRAQIQATLDIFSARQTDYQALSSAPVSSIGDPSK
jgi:hypothetical protein